MDSCRIESCDEDVVDGCAPLELEDPLERPGTTVGTKFCALRGRFLKMWFPTTGPLIGISMIVAALSKR